MAKNLEHQNSQVMRALRASLKFRNNRVSIINSDPSSRAFVFWFMISCYFPLIAACLGPIANTISIACVVDKWREWGVSRNKNGDITANQVRDPTDVFVLNIISLVIGFVSNVVLLFHFARKLSYLKSQLINITGWTAAGVLLLVDVIVCGTRDVKPRYQKTIGFWYACFTSGLYLGCALVLSIHYIGYVLKKYPATFNLLPNERSIMVFTVMFSLWLIWGAAMFSGLLGISFGNALYFCTVSLLTIGLGDILADNVSSKIMILVFSISGVIILGLIVYMTRSIIQKSSGPVWYFHRLERKRSKIWKKVCAGELKLTDEESFDLMTKVKRVSKIRENIFSVTTTILIFSCFWLLGACVFHFCEGWSYFNCIYFCFLCLLTIGYGSDYAPETGAGRAFFVLWSIGAVPLMGAILSTVGDLLFDMSDSIDVKLGEKFDSTVKSIVINGKGAITSLNFTRGTLVDTEAENQTGIEDKPLTESQRKKVENLDIVKEYNSSLEDNDESDRSFSVIPSLDGFSEYDLTLERMASNQSVELNKLKELRLLLKSLSRLHKISVEDKNFKLNYKQWKNLHSLHTHEEELEGYEKTNFWVSDLSPLKYPLNEAHFAFLRLSEAVDKLVSSLIEKDEAKVDSLRPVMSNLLSRHGSIVSRTKSNGSTHFVGDNDRARYNSVSVAKSHDDVNARLRSDNIRSRKATGTVQLQTDRESGDTRENYGGSTPSILSSNVSSKLVDPSPGHSNDGDTRSYLTDVADSESDNEANPAAGHFDVKTI
ncbi:Tok1p KNAG_0B01800 [Huiozyma naganishii CBS 8797]|uniref:Potassium channel domain-containing protein n=1 Tax=Huiozyma naganishii (strain ATCC MYA-139 / BCRC 22969 / CBS 8797 / KCTC 17520 / NBRC 10181 / NCYC 3082 / Yp74L-3) TaxID=1071383 RepID=J7RGF3_HUIN7|nr:hypothetical protein KNAG_0B01800 [Kazachstania naganishii CBS 8797]CCK68623.1 hypothetical protein KNAG_0B01800 [Kazachstania naganishii CBS 8797]